MLHYQIHETNQRTSDYSREYLHQPCFLTIDRLHSDGKNPWQKMETRGTVVLRRDQSAPRICIEPCALAFHLGAVSRISKRRQGDSGLLFYPLPSGWIAIGGCGVRNNRDHSLLGWLRLLRSLSCSPLGLRNVPPFLLAICKFSGRFWR